VDMFGNPRTTWTRGAIEFSSGMADTTPPVIANVAASSVTPSDAVIGWTTDEVANSVVDYGTSTAYGSSVTNVSLGLSHSVALGSLVPNTLYHYRARSIDGPGNIGTSADFSFTTLTADTTPPTVALTAPSNGLIVSNKVSITATASDNLGVVGVAFFVSGTQVSAVASSPYSFAWDSTMVTNGTYKIFAQARDAQGNVAWSSTNSVTVNNIVGSLPTPSAYWSFNEGAGTAARSSVSTNALTLRSGATWSAAGKDHASLSLDGVTGRAEASNSPELNVNGSAITVSTWVNLQSQGTWQQIVAKVHEVGASTSPYFSWHVFGAHVSSTQWTPQFQLVTTGGVSVNVGSSLNVNYGEWVHVVGVYDGSAVRIYVNGVDRGSAAQSGTILDYTQPLYIGSSGLPDEFARGLVDEVRVYSVALSAAQVMRIYETPCNVLISAISNQ